MGRCGSAFAAPTAHDAAVPAERWPAPSNPDPTLTLTLTVTLTLTLTLALALALTLKLTLILTLIPYPTPTPALALTRRHVPYQDGRRRRSRAALRTVGAAALGAERGSSPG